MYLHLYFSGEQALEHKNRFNALLDWLEVELVFGNRKAEHEKQYAKYFEITSTPKPGTKVTLKLKAITQAKKDYEFFALISNEIKDPIAALNL